MMEEKGLAKREVGGDLMERVVIQGDLKDLTPKQRVEYYGALCKSLGLNPLTKPFDYIVLNGRVTLYAKKDCTDQVRANRGISITITSRELVEGVYVVTAKGTDQSGRTDESIGAVAIDTLKGDARANALMKAETKAKRRVTLSLGGLGWLDETEIETIPDARTVKVSVETGEIEARATPIPPAPPATTAAVKPPPEHDHAGARERVAEKRAAKVAAGQVPEHPMSRDDAKEQFEVLKKLVKTLGVQADIATPLIESWRDEPWTQERLDGIRLALELNAPPIVAKQPALGEPEPRPEEGQ